MATALYRRYRPESFAEVIGQDHVTTPLRRALRAGRIGHAYLFSGPRGCGKTTSARILARCLNCAQGPTDVPCGECDSCRDLANGGAGSLDVVEIDAASHGGVDDARELRERASFAPVRDRFKVFIIDEAHMVTSAGFNALLKLVEEPPEHVKFVFATTEPDKVIGTIRSRTHHYPFRLIPPQVLGPYLEEVCAAEGVQVGEGVMPLVVRAGGGSARDSMSVLDQLMAGAGDDGLDFPTAIALLGFTDTALLDTAITAVAERDAAALYGAVEHVLATGHEPRRFVEDLLERMRDLIVLAAVPDRGADLLPQVPADELESMRGQAALFAPADLSQCGDLVHETLSTMSGATSPRLHLELLAARLVLRDERAALAAAGAPAAAADQRGGAPSDRGGQPGPAPTQGAPAGPSGAREEARRIAQEKVEAARQTRGGRGGGPAAAAGAPAPDQQGTPGQQGTAPAPQAPAQQGAPAASQAPAPQAAASQAPVDPAAAQPPQGAPAQQPSAPAQPAPGGGIDAEQVRGHWSAILDELQQIRRPSWALISQNGQVNGAHGNTLVIGFRTEGLVGAFHRGTGAQNLADAVRRIMHVEVTIAAVVGDDPGPGGGNGAGPGPGPGGAGGGAPDGPAPAPETGPAPAQGTPETDGQSAPAHPGQDAPPRAAAPQPAGGADPSGQAPSGQGAPARWGDAVSAKTPRGPAPAPRGSAPTAASAAPEEAPAASAGQRASERAMRAAERAAQGSRPGPSAEPVEDFPPEPDDPFPPDPQDDYQPRAQPSTGAVPGAAAAPASGGRWSDALPEGEERSSGALAPAAASGSAVRIGDTDSAAEGVSGPGSTATGAGAAAGGEIPVVEDEGRDSLPPAESRTYGQNALRRALAEGRVVHSRPAQNAAGGTASPGGDTWAEQAGATADAGSDQSQQGDQGDQGGQGAEAGPPALQAVPPVSPSSADGTASAAAAASSPGPEDSASARAAASWGTAATASAPQSPPTGHPAEGTPSAATSWSAGTPSAPAPSALASAPSSAASPTAAPSAPRSGAALVREAAHATRTGGLRTGNRSGGASAEPGREADLTGGATRDDEDAVVATRNGREVVEQLLGGKVLEIIDETRNY